MVLSEKFFDFFCFSVGMLVVLVMVLLFGVSCMGIGWLLMKLVNVEEKYSCCRLGVWKFVLVVLCSIYFGVSL